MKRRIIQGSALAVGLVLAICSIVLIANAGATPDPCPLDPSLAGVGCFLRSYKELAAGLIGTAGAIFAAWIAWVAIQTQLKHEDELSVRQLNQAREAISFHLRDHLECVNQVWRAIDFALAAKQPARQASWADMVGAMFTGLSAKANAQHHKYARRFRRRHRGIRLRLSTARPI